MIGCALTLQPAIVMDSKDMSTSLTIDEDEFQLSVTHHSAEAF
jgi:hypothetical protein